MTDHENEPPDDLDPLFLVLTGADVDAATRATPAYRAADTDVAELRAQIRRLGDVLAISTDPHPDATPEADTAAAADTAPLPSAAGAPATRPVPFRPRPRPLVPRRRRLQRYVLAVCVTGVIGLGGVGLGQLAISGVGTDESADSKSAEAWPAAGDKGQESAPDSQFDSDSDSDSASDAAKAAPTALLACAASIAEGTVTDVVGDRVTLDVDRWFKPADGGSGLTFTEPGAGSRAEYAPGARVLVIVPADPERPVRVHGADALPDASRWVERRLKDAAGVPCEPPGR